MNTNKIGILLVLIAAFCRFAPPTLGGHTTAELIKEAATINAAVELLTELGDTPTAQIIKDRYTGKAGGRLQFGTVSGNDNAETDPLTHETTLNPKNVTDYETWTTFVEKSTNIRRYGTSADKDKLKATAARSAKKNQCATAEEAYATWLAGFISTVMHETIHSKQPKSLFDSDDTETSQTARDRESPAYGEGLDQITSLFTRIGARLGTSTLAEDKFKWQTFRIGVLKAWKTYAHEMSIKLQGKKLNKGQTFIDPLDGTTKTLDELDATLANVDSELAKLRLIDLYARTNATTDTTPGTIGQQAPTTTGPVKFSATIPDNWEGGETPDGFALTRKPAKIKTAHVSATLFSKFPAAISGKPGLTASGPQTAGDCLAAAEKAFKARRQGSTPSDMAVGLAMVGGIEGAHGLSMGDFQGAVADHALWLRRGSWGVGYTSSYFGCNGEGNAVKDNRLVHFGYSVIGGGSWDNSDREYLVSQGEAAQVEARTILASLRVGLDGVIRKEPYVGPRYDGSDPTNGAPVVAANSTRRNEPVVAQNDDVTVAPRNRTASAPETKKHDREIMSNFNRGGVMNSPTKPDARFRLKKAYELTGITTYHWNDGKGMSPGTISLKDEGGRLVGHWQARSRAGAGGAPNVYWDVHPNMGLKPGIYTLTVSRPEFWSWNSETGGSGMFQIHGEEKGEPTNVSTPAGSVVGTWTYHHTSGAFTDIHVYHADGTVTAPRAGDAHATWRVEGDEIVTVWHNKWSNRLKLPITGSTIYGVSISPTGGSAEVTLTRVANKGEK